MRAGRGGPIAAVVLAVVLTAATAAMIIVDHPLLIELNGGLSWTGDDDPALLHYLQISTTHGILMQLITPTATAAAAAIVVAVLAVVVNATRPVHTDAAPAS